MSLAPQQKVQTIVKGDAAPYGDVTADSQLQDNAFDSGLWDRAGVPDSGASTPAAKSDSVAPTPPGYPGNPKVPTGPGGYPVSGKQFADGSATQES